LREIERRRTRALSTPLSAASAASTAMGLLLLALLRRTVAAIGTLFRIRQ
jgi:hypothetical protein